MRFEEEVTMRMNLLERALHVREDIKRLDEKIRRIDIRMERWGMYEHALDERAAAFYEKDEKRRELHRITNELERLNA